MSKSRTLTNVRQRAKIPALRFEDMVDEFTRNPDVRKFTIDVDKGTGITRLNALGSDGRVFTKTILGPGLEEVVRYDPFTATTADRDANIRMLLSRGHTQMETASRLGVSQALVSKVHRSK